MKLETSAQRQSNSIIKVTARGGGDPQTWAVVFFFSQNFIEVPETLLSVYLVK